MASTSACYITLPPCQRRGPPYSPSSLPRAQIHPMPGPRMQHQPHPQPAIYPGMTIPAGTRRCNRGPRLRIEQTDENLWRALGHGDRYGIPPSHCIPGEGSGGVGPFPFSKLLCACRSRITCGSMGNVDFLRMWGFAGEPEGDAGLPSTGMPAPTPAPGLSGEACAGAPGEVDAMPVPEPAGGGPALLFMPRPTGKVGTVGWSSQLFTITRTGGHAGNESRDAPIATRPRDLPKALYHPCSAPA